MSNENLNAAPAAAAPAAPKSKMVAGLLAIFLGWIGAHKFYLGYQKEAIIMLAVGIVGFLCLGIGTSIMSVIGIIEGIMYLTKSDEEFEKTYVTGRKPWF